MRSVPRVLFFFFFNDTATTEIYTLSLHDALPISQGNSFPSMASIPVYSGGNTGQAKERSEEHTSELQSPCNLVCRLLLEKKKINSRTSNTFQCRYRTQHCTTT